MKIRISPLETETWRVDQKVQLYVDFIAKGAAKLIKKFENKREKFELESSEAIVYNILYDFEKLKIKLDQKGPAVLYEDNQ